MDSTGGVYVALSEKANVLPGQAVRVTGRLAEIARLVIVSSRIDLVEPLPRRCLVQPETIRTGSVGVATEGGS